MVTDHRRETFLHGAMPVLEVSLPTNRQACMMYTNEILVKIRPQQKPKTYGARYRAILHKIKHRRIDQPVSVVSADIFYLLYELFEGEIFFL